MNIDVVSSDTRAWRSSAIDEADYSISCCNISPFVGISSALSPRQQLCPILLIDVHISHENLPPTGGK
jgi:hypothetical protein